MSSMRKYHIPRTNNGGLDCDYRDPKTGMFACSHRAVYRIAVKSVHPGFSCGNPDHIKNVKDQAKKRLERHLLNSARLV